MDISAFYFPVFWLLIAVLVIGLMVVSTGMAFYKQKILLDPLHGWAVQRQLHVLNFLRNGIRALAALLVIFGSVLWWANHRAESRARADQRARLIPAYDASTLWHAPDPYLAETDEHRELIAYGRDLIAHTQDYFGEEGIVRPGSINNLNCQSCHLDAGSKPFGNNYFAVASTYPQMRARSGSLETMSKRVNDCFQRSLNGQAIDTTGREMRAILAYIKWLGTGVPKGEKPKGTGLVEVPMLDRAADPERGKYVYQSKCASCHGPNGQGGPMPDSPREYPPLWGEKSYNEAAGLFRLSRLAGYVKANMPFGASFDNPQLSDEEAWDVAAFINSQARPPHPFLSTDWPDIGKKPFDHPFGPYKDTFPEIMHKYGPFGPIVAFQKQNRK